MKALFSDRDLTRVSYAKGLLEAADIPCVIQNENTRTLGPSIYGYSSTNLLDPILCIFDDSQLQAATEILHAQLGVDTVDSPEWLCPACNESNPGTFDLCWNCGAARP